MKLLLEQASSLLFGKTIASDLAEDSKTLSISHTLTGNKRYRVDYVGFWRNKQVVILQLEVRTKGKREGDYYPHEIINIDEVKYCDAQIQDLTVFK